MNKAFMNRNEMSKKKKQKQNERLQKNIQERTYIWLRNMGADQLDKTKTNSRDVIFKVS